MRLKLSRRVLHDLVWNEPRTVLAKRIGFSDVGLSKACRKAGIPMPPRGYWARLAAGKTGSKTSLPSRGLGQSDNVVIGNLDYRAITDEEALKLPPEPFFDEPVEVVRERAENLLARYRVPKGLHNPHRLIAALMDEDAARRKALETDRFVWHKPQFDSPAAQRRIRLVNALFGAMVHAGCSASVRSNDLQKIAFCVGDTFISVEITTSGRAAPSKMGVRSTAHERITIKSKGWPHTAHTVDVPHEWSDGDTQSLETRISEVARDLLVMGEFTYRAAAHQQYKWLVERKHKLEADCREANDRLKRDEDERRLREEAKQRDWLLLQAANRGRAEEIRALVCALDSNYEASFEVASNGAYCKWRAWALEQADLLDPCVQPLATVITPPKSDAVHKI
jgi:hypothetical protein